MTGEVSLPVTGMDGMWRIETIISDYINLGKLQDTIDNVSGAIPPNTNNSITCPTIPGYTPAGIVGYNITNDAAGNSESWVFPYCINFNSGAGTVSYKIRNISNIGSKSTANYQGGGAAKIKIYFRVLYLRKSDSEITYVPQDPVTNTSVSLSYGLTAYVTRYGRMCQIMINGAVNSAVAAWATIGNLPKPLNGVITPNDAYMNSYLNVTPNGILQSSVNIPNGYYVQCTFTYITAE